MKKYLQILFFFTLLASFQLKAQVRFETKLSKTRLGLNERLRVSFEMNENGDNFIPPTFEGFTVVGGPNQSVSNSYVNGKRSFSKSYTYFLTPEQKGELTIGQASIEIQGEVYKTSPRKVIVTEAVKRPNSAQAQADAFADENLHLVAEVSNTNPYLNEAFTVVYKLYYTSDLGISNVNEAETPKYSDFLTHVIPIKKLEIKRGTYKGKNYNYVVWRKAVLYPQKSGKVSLDPLTLNISVDVPTNRRTFFGDRVYNKIPKKITAGRRTINVKALPENGKPENFSGAVGTFDLNVSLNKEELKSSESFQVSVKVSGRGNLKLFSLPTLEVPSALERYEPEHKEMVKTNLLGMQGSIEDNYTIVPQYQGNYPIPGVAFSYFDPVKENYVTLRSEEKIINVFEGPQPQISSVQQPKKAQNIIGKQSPKQFEFIKLETTLMPLVEKHFYGTRLFYLLWISPLVLLLLFFWGWNKWSNRTVDVQNQRQRKAQRLVRKYLGSARKAMGDKVAFYDALERALHNYLKAKLSIETVEFSKDRIQALLQEKGVFREDIDAFIALLTDCDANRYAPSTSARMEEDFAQASNVISKLDKVL